MRRQREKGDTEGKEKLHKGSVSPDKLFSKKSGRERVRLSQNAPRSQTNL